MLNNLILEPLAWLGQFFMKLFWATLWVFGLAVLVWYSMRWWPGDSFWPVRLVNYLMPWLLVGLLPGLVAALLARRKWLAMTLVIPVAMIGLAFAPLFLPRTNPALAENQNIRVMSFNMWAGNKDLTAIDNLLHEIQPDVLLLQEVTAGMATGIQRIAPTLYPDGQYHWAYEPDIGQAILSRYPLSPISHSFEKGRVQKAIMHTDSGPVAVWNVHPSQPLPYYWQYNQLRNLTGEIEAETLPLIVAGDFNTTDQSETYHMVNQYLKNAHWDAGWGFGFSFPAPTRRFGGKVSFPSMVRIDHIFYSDHFYAHHARTLADSGGSDHRPVIADLIPIGGN